MSKGDLTPDTSEMTVKKKREISSSEDFEPRQAPTIGSTLSGTGVRFWTLFYKCTVSDCPQE
jgi:hypothetical protein